MIPHLPTFEEFPVVAERLADPESAMIVSYSGGLDSTACLLLALSQYMGPTIVHHQVIAEDWHDTIPYARAVCEHLGLSLIAQQGIYVYGQRPNGSHGYTGHVLDIPADRDTPYTREEAAALLGVSAEDTMAGILDMAEHRGAPPTAGIRWCTSYFKRAVFDRWVRQNRKRLRNPVTLIGYRRAESARRAKQPWARRRDAVSLKSGWEMYDAHPILEWSKQDTYDLMKAWKIEPPAGYRMQGVDFSRPLDEGMPRYSCVNCIFANGCHMATAATTAGLVTQWPLSAADQDRLQQTIGYARPYLPALDLNATATHARATYERTLEFQRVTGMTWQQGGALDPLANAMGEDPFRKETGQLALDLKNVT